MVAAGNAFTFSTNNNACIKLTKPKLDSCDDGLEDGGGDSPLIVDVEEAVASIPADILDPPSDSVTQASPAAVAS